MRHLRGCERTESEYRQTLTHLSWSSSTLGKNMIKSKRLRLGHYERVQIG